MARSRSGHDRSAEIDRHREGQALCSQRCDEAGSGDWNPRGADVACGKVRRRPSDVFRGHTLDATRPPELVQAASADFAEPNAYPVDARGLAYSYAYIGIKRLGAGQFYLISIKDKDGQR